MPKIDKPKKKKRGSNLLKGRSLPKKLTNLPVATKATKSQKIKHSPVEYYNCLLTQAQNDWFDPTTGQKKKITQCCRDCKTKAPALNQQRQQELEKLITSYRQVGDSLSKLLKPIK